MKKFIDLSEQEILALAISLEEEDERIYADFADALRDEYPVIRIVKMGAEKPPAPASAAEGEAAP